MKIENIWKAIESGKQVCWEHEGYEVHPVKTDLNEYSKHSYKNGKALRVSCISNYFGSLIDPSEFKNCFITKNKPELGGKK